MWNNQPIRFFFQIDNLFNKSDIFRQTVDTNEPIPGEPQIWSAGRTFRIGFVMDADWTK